MSPLCPSQADGPAHPPYRWGLWFLLGLSLNLASCTYSPAPNATPSIAASPVTASPPASPPPPAIIATAPVLCDLAQQIVQNDLTITCLIPPGQDPHTYEPTPSDRRAIETAQLILYGGYGFESNLTKLLETSPATKIAIFEKAVPQPLLGKAHDHQGEDHGGNAPGTETQSAAAPEPDPHVWHNAANAAQIANAIGQALAPLKLNTRNQASGLYQTRTQTLVQQFGQLDSWIKTQTATIPAPARKLVTTHEALGYYAQAYGLSLTGALEGLSSDERPTPETLAALTKTLRSTQVPAVFAAATSTAGNGTAATSTAGNGTPGNSNSGDSTAGNSDRKLLDTIAQEAKVPVAAQPLYMDGPGGLDSPAPTTQRMFVHNTCAIVNTLGGTCDPNTAPL